VVEQHVTAVKTVTVAPNTAVQIRGA